MAILKNLLVVLLASLCFSPVVQSQSVSLDRVDGLLDEGRLPAASPVVFHLRMTNNTEQFIVGVSNGFRLYSTDGATWAASEFIDTIIEAFPPPGVTTIDTTYYGAWEDEFRQTGLFDGGMYVNPMIHTTDDDRYGSCSHVVGFGGFSVNSVGLFPQFEMTTYAISIDSFPQSAAGKHFCLDSAFFHPVGYWKWAGEGGWSTNPSWDGTHCYEIVGSGGSQITADFCSLAGLPVYDFETGQGGNTIEEPEGWDPGWGEYYDPYLRALFLALARGETQYHIEDPWKTLRVSSIIGEGSVVIRLQQYYAGIRVTGGSLVVHMNSEMKITYIAGDYVAVPDVTALVAVSLDSALHIVSRELVGRSDACVLEDSSLVLRTVGSEWHLCYSLVVSSDWLRYRYAALVDAVTGDVLSSWIHGNFFPPPDPNTALILPTRFELYQNFPNPFNPATEIVFDVPETDRIKLVIYNSLGQRVRTLVDRTLEAGIHSYYFDGSGIASGVYFYRLQATNFEKTRRMILVK